MSTINQAIVRRYIDEVWNQRNLAVLDEIMAADSVSHDMAPGMQAGIEGLKQGIQMYLNAFPDLHFTVELEIAQGDLVATRWTSRGTHRGELMGIPPTGKTVTVTGIDINRIAGGKLVEHWGNYDMLGMLQQLGVVPMPGAAAG